MEKMMSKTKHNAQPATDIVVQLGGCRSVARQVGVSPSAVSRWCTPSALGGTGGRIPQKWWKQMISAGKDCGVTLDAKQLSGLSVIG